MNNSSKIELREVHHIADLARLKLTPNEVQKIAKIKIFGNFLQNLEDLLLVVTVVEIVFVKKQSS